MTDLIKQLNTEFCQELNNAWLQAIENNDGQHMVVKNFDGLLELIKEAKEQGYGFNLDYSPNLFIEERIMGKQLENELIKLPEWNQLAILINMLNQCEDNQWTTIKTHLQELKSQRIQPILLAYAIQCTKDKGPFFAGNDPSFINVFGTCGSVAHEILLITLLFAKS
jgi:hypothetical protein